MLIIKILNIDPMLLNDNEITLIARSCAQWKKY